MARSFIPVKKMLERLESSKQESDSAYFFDLLYLGEMLTKLVVSSMIAAVNEEKERNRYRLLHRIVRADGIGEWSAILEETLTGVAAQFIQREARHNELTELTQKAEIGTWQYDSVRLLIDAINLIGVPTNFDQPKRIQGKTWFSHFATLRNGTRGHGAVLPSSCSRACKPLERSIMLIVDNFYLFKREWVYLYQNMSGKYRVTKLNQTSTYFDKLKSETAHEIKYPNGIYIFFDERVNVDLIHSTPEADDFFFPNGNFKLNTFEIISYITDKRIEGDSTKYLTPANELPESETEGLGDLNLLGNCFTNLPSLYKNYISRIDLEKELLKTLKEEDRYPIITLKGIGGIGKTSLALSVLHRITEEKRFDVILWFSSRDIDLTVEGAKTVKNKILSEEDIANEFVNLLGIKGLNKQEKIDFLSREMTKSSYGSILFVFDNFETVKNPVELFNWVDTYIRNPNKIVITSRISKSFKADYPIEISGMNGEECRELIRSTSSEFGVYHLLNERDIEKIIIESGGHPYVIRIFLGEISKNGKVTEVKRIVANKDDILTALFRRTYNWLSPAAKRVFLTLCSWRSVIPQIAIEAVLLRDENERINVAEAIDELRKSSFIEVITSAKDNEVFLSVPLAASIFGKAELEVSPEKYAIFADRELLQEFGAAQQTDINNGVHSRIERKFQTIANKINQGKARLEPYLPTLEYIASKYPSAWLYLASIYEENSNVNKAIESYKEFLKNDVSEYEKKRIWQRLADIYRTQNEYFYEVNALVEKCALNNSSIFESSEVANVINKYFQSGLLNIDTDIKEKLIQKLIYIIESKLIISSMDATDYSRLAWLYLNIKNSDKAKETVTRGLLIDQDNPYCVKLATKLGI